MWHNFVKKDWSGWEMSKYDKYSGCGRRVGLKKVKLKSIGKENKIVVFISTENEEFFMANTQYIGINSYNYYSDENEQSDMTLCVDSGPDSGPDLLLFKPKN